MMARANLRHFVSWARLSLRGKGRRYLRDHALNALDRVFGIYLDDPSAWATN